MKFKKYTAQQIDEIKSDIKITYVLYRVLGNGALQSYGQSESFDRLTNNKWLQKSDKGQEFVIKKRVTQLKEEPIFKVVA